MKAYLMEALCFVLFVLYLKLVQQRSHLQWQIDLLLRIDLDHPVLTTKEV